MPLIQTPEILRKVCSRLHPDRAAKITQLLNSICLLYGINNTDILHEFLANLAHESAEFTRYEENLNYASEALINKFGRHRISEADAYRYGRNLKHPADQQAIADLIYGGQWGFQNLGNKLLHDGFNFRGSGPIQLTGRANFEAFGAWMEKTFQIKHTAEEWAELLRTNDEYAIHSACWLFAISKKLIDEAVDDKMKEIVKKINGGYNGIIDRMEYYELCKKYIL